MARPVWNGTISFGLLNVPVQIFSGERTVDLHFRMLDSRDQKPIRYERVNSETGEEVAWKDIVKAFEYEKGNYVVIPEQELRAAAPKITETVEIEAFVERDAISPMYFEKPYFLIPGKKAEKGYVLLRETLESTGRIGIGKVVIRTRQYLAALLPQGDALLLNLMRFPQELVPPDQFELPTGKPAQYRVSALELKMAAQLIESMSTDWKPAEYRDDFRDQLHKFVERRIARASGGKRRAAEHAQPHAPGASNVVDFMALLKKSLAAKGRRTGGAPKPDVPAVPRSGRSERRKPRSATPRAS
jgi:DNA end-binding protein Ku